MRIYVGGLTDHLSDLKDQDLKELFSPFGEIEFVDLHRDISTGKSKGFAFIQYKNANDAKEAINKMNGFLLRNKPLKVFIFISKIQILQKLQIFIRSAQFNKTWQASRITATTCT